MRPVGRSHFWVRGSSVQRVGAAAAVKGNTRLRLVCVELDCLRRLRGRLSPPPLLSKKNGGKGRKADVVGLVFGVILGGGGGALLGWLMREVSR